MGSMSAQPSVPPFEGIWLDPSPMVEFLTREHHRVWQRAYWDHIEHPRRGLSMGKLQVNWNWNRTGVVNAAIDRQARWIMACKIGEFLGTTPNAAHTRILKWRNGGRITVWQADRTCAAFNRHISEVYGSDWEDSDRCSRGHELSGDNLYVREDRGQRRCRECHRQQIQDARSRRRALGIAPAVASCRICGAQIRNDNMARHLKRVHAFDDACSDDIINAGKVTVAAS